MKKICKNCSEWNREDATSYGSCESPKIVYQEAEENSKKDELIYWDHESYSAGFKTGENFGCVHFVKKEVKGETKS